MAAAETALGVLAAVILAVVIAVRVVFSTAPWLATYRYEICEAEVRVRARYLNRFDLPEVRLPYRTIAEVRVGEGGGPGRTLPFRFGRKRLLGSTATAETVDLKRRGLRSLAVLTPPDPPEFARGVRQAMISDRARRGDR